MPTLEEVGQSLGLSYRQVFRRYSAVRHLIPAEVRKGDNGALILDGGAVAILRRLEDSRKEGRTLREAVELVARELNGNRGNESGKPWNEKREEPTAEDPLVTELRARIAGLERENERLWRLVNEQLPRLTAPQERRPWWWPLRRLVFGG